ncbi:MAG: fluoride efflux transporter CrcB [Thermomicrobiales bacterium]
MEYLWVGLGGFAGANARYILGRWMISRFGDAFPYGTMLINITGSLLIGFVLALLVGKASLADPAWRLLLIAGVLGGYTTFSAFAAESVRLIEDGRLAAAISYIVGTNVLAILACIVGLGIGRALVR